MIDAQLFEDMLKRLTDAIPPSLQNVKQDLERNFRAVLQSTFNKFDLVTREEFDAQAGVLLKTRSKVDVLEKQLAELEKQLLDKTS